MPKRSFRFWLLRIAAMAAILFTTPALAGPDVSPSSRVTAAVVVRSEPTTQSGALARLRPGETLELQGEVSSWYRVTLPDGRTGYVSKAWTDEVPETAVAALPQWRVHFVDVGTGLATFVEGPEFTLVYDAGSNDDYAVGEKNRFLAYLRLVRPDLQVIDHVILSHPHRDHVELLPDLFDAYEVRNVWDSGRIHDICGYRSFLTKIATEPGVTYHDAHPPVGFHSVALAPKPACGTSTSPFVVSIPHGQTIVRGLIVPIGSSAQMTFLHADATYYTDEVNRNSVPVRLDLGDARLLFMGDAEAGERYEAISNAPHSSSIEGQVMDCCAGEIRADLLVAGHHGSRTSSRIPFLDAVGATIFIISSGPKKYSGTALPDPAIVQELDNRGDVWSTDIDDVSCRVDLAKIGPDADNRAGGCDNILVRIPMSGPPIINYERISD